MANIESLALQLLGAKGKKAEIERRIKMLERELLDSKEISAMLTPIHNEGGERTDGAYTVEIPRTHVWDQIKIDEILEDIPRPDWPSFVNQTITYKVDMRKFKDYVVSHPQDAGQWHDAHFIKLGDPKIKNINAEKLKEE